MRFADDSQTKKKDLIYIRVKGVHCALKKTLWIDRGGRGRKKKHWRGEKREETIPPLGGGGVIFPKGGAKRGKGAKEASK